MDNMNLNQLKYFSVLAKVQHYTKAANILSISQPSLSNSISSLEEELGTELFEKKGRNIFLTKYGRVFLKYVDSALDTLELGEKEIYKITGSSKGLVDLAYTNDIDSTFLPNIIEKFYNSSNEKSQISFSFNQEDNLAIIDGLQDGRYDLGLCSHVIKTKDIEFLPIKRQNLSVIVSDLHELSNYESVDLRDISSYAMISFNPNNLIYKSITDMFVEVSTTPNVICEVKDIATLASLVNINYGISIVPETQYLNNFNVKVIPINNPFHERFIYLAFSKEKFQSPMVRLFKNFILEQSKIEFL